jgi:hypothetical protein
MGLNVLETVGLCIAVPALLLCLRRSKIILLAQIILAAVLGAMAVPLFRDAKDLEQALDQRVHYKLPDEPLGPQRLTITPLRRMEGMQVSVVDFPRETEPSVELVKTVGWELDGPESASSPHATWFREAGERLPEPGDGIPLFEMGDRFLNQPVTLHYEVTPKNQDLLRSIRLRVRPDWFSRKMLPPIVGLLQLHGSAFVVGLVLSIAGAIKNGIRLRRGQGPPPSSSVASGQDAP